MNRAARIQEDPNASGNVIERRVHHFPVQDRDFIEMTEREWQESVNPQQMLEFIQGKASDRKLRLFAVRAFRRVAFLREEEWGRIFEVAERHADGKATNVELVPLRSMPEHGPVHTWAANLLLGTDTYTAATFALGWATLRKDTFIGKVIYDRPEERPIQATLLREIFGCLFLRPATVHPSWLSWNDTTVPKIAQAIYDERRFEDLPILADALEDAGCDNEDILRHCRGPGDHVLGCWVVDLLLGKE